MDALHAWAQTQADPSDDCMKHGFRTVQLLFTGYKQGRAKLQNDGLVREILYKNKGIAP